MVYQWKSVSRIRADANEAGAMFEHLEATVGLTPQNLLEANRAEGTPLHNEFEWDDNVAAEAYRITQARYMIQMLCIKPEENEESNTPIRAFFKTEEKSGYESLSVIMRHEDKCAAMLRRALKELEAFKRKYAVLEELVPVFDAIEAIVKEE